MMGAAEASSIHAAYICRASAARHRHRVDQRQQIQGAFSQATVAFTAATPSRTAGVAAAPSTHYFQFFKAALQHGREPAIELVTQRLQV